MRIKYQEFEKQANEHNYTPRVEKPGKTGEFYFIKTRKNNVKTELKLDYYTIGWGLKSEELDTLLSAVLEAGFTQHIAKSKSLTSQCYHFNFRSNNPEDILSDFWMLASIIEDISGLVARRRGVAIKPFSKEVCEDNIFEKIARTYQFAIEIEHGNLLDTTRNLLEADSIDHLVTVGESVDRTEDNSYREHVVPAIMIHNEAVRMTLAGIPYTEVAQMIKSNLAIVRITNEEANLLDVVLGYRTTMPQVNGRDWAFGDDVFARLVAGKIALK